MTYPACKQISASSKREEAGHARQILQNGRAARKLTVTFKGLGTGGGTEVVRTQDRFNPR